MSSLGEEGGRTGRAQFNDIHPQFFPPTQRLIHTKSSSYSLLFYISISSIVAGRRITNFNMSDGTVIIRSLGFHPESMSFNTFMLFAYLMAALGTAYLVLCFCVKERR